MKVENQEYQPFSISVPSSKWDSVILNKYMIEKMKSNFMLVPKNSNFRIVNDIQMHIITTEYLPYGHSPNPCPLNYVCACVCVCAHTFAHAWGRGGCVCSLVCVKHKGTFFTFLHLFTQDMLLAVRGQILNKRQLME